MNLKYILFFLFCSFSLGVFGQGVLIEGYVFESDNRGYLNEARIEAINLTDGSSAGEAFTNIEGYFKLDLPPGNYAFDISKSLFHDQTVNMTDAATSDGNKHFFKITMRRKPGYLFDITLANKRDSANTVVDAIHDARIEVYNNTTDKVEFATDAHPSPNFQYTITKGNHYTMLLRKEGYLAKRIEAFVDVKGCILCIEGLDRMSPGVTDNLTEGHSMGTLLANVEMEPVTVGTTIEIDNIYYETGQYKLTEDAKAALQNVINLMRDNPLIEIEIGSHTDSRGRDELNIELSQRRANEVVEHMIEYGGIAADRLRARGFGDTQLVNDCEEGVPCSEVKHAENRRTELKVTGIRRSLTADKSLAEIKEMEKMEKLIQELQNQEVIEIKEGEELPDEIKKQVEKKKKRN